MLTTILFFVVGLALGFISLRLLSLWEPRDKASGAPDELFRHHS
jgi:hypothetical protein